jgi:2-keto-4-pentenoate hydratase/2-oxohepta-3-ene-1,7-dioic acid hydratase in catechol pathway
LRLLSFQADNAEQFGAIIDGRIVSLSDRMPEYATLDHVLAAGALVRAQDIAASSSADYGLKDIRYRPPVTNPGKIICIGDNYVRSHSADAEHRDNRGPDEHPSVHLRTRESLVGHLEPILKPPEAHELDYAGEIALIIGREGRRIPRADALGHIAGITLMNSGCVRDWMGPATRHITQGTNFERSGAMGPWLVTADECSPGASLHLVTRVNGEIRQDDETSCLHFPFDYLISYLSTFLRLRPGDVISTGTPAGTGAQLDTAKFLTAEDRVEIEVPEVGVLENRVQDEALETE